MSEDLAKLVVKLEAQTAQYQRELDKANRKLGKFGKSTTKTIDGLRGSFKSLVLPVASLAGAAAGLGKLISTARKFDVINSSLITVTGSAENAAAAFKRIEKFAATTPFQLDEVANAFVKMLALGLDPCEKALASYGNTASAMGKSLNQMIEAVADAATGEFERLKEFGIKASSNGDKVKLTFRGMTKEIGKNASEIEGYLKAIGENEFAGAMETRAKTLDGALSNLEDSWDSLFREVARSGAGDEITANVRELAALLQDPQTLEAAKTLASTLISGLSVAASTASDLIIALQRIDGLAMDASIAEIDSEIRRVQETIEGGFGERLRFFGKDGIVEYYDDAELQQVLNELKARKQELLSDPAQGLKEIIPQGSRRNSSLDPKKGNSARKARERELESVMASLRSEEEAIQESYRRRREIILENTEANSTIRTELLGKLEQDRADALGREFESIKRGLQNEEEALLESYNKRREIILASTEGNELERRELLKRLTDETLQEVEVTATRIHKNIKEKSDSNDMLKSYENSFGQMSDATREFAGEQSGIYAAMFAVEKAAAIARSIVAIQTGIAQAASVPWPANLAAMASVAAATAGIVSTIASVTYGGAREKGGPVDGGKAYLVGEKGPEIIVPSTGGSVIPNHELGGGGTQVINLLDTDSTAAATFAHPGMRETVINIIKSEERTIRALAAR